MKKACLGCSGNSSECKDKLSWRQLIMSGVAAVMVYLGLVMVSGKVFATKPTACLTLPEVEEIVIKENKCLTVYDNKVYDFTTAKKWDITGHVGQHLCGKVYDKKTIEAGPHKVAVMDKFFSVPVCGTGVAPSTTVSWFSLRKIMIYVSLLFFILNFATCYAMPWGTWREPWSGDFPGPDEKDRIGHFPMTHWHKIWAWCAIFSLSLHALLGFSCMLLGKCY